MGLIRKSLNFGTAGVIKPESKKQRYARKAAGEPSMYEKAAQGWSMLAPKPKTLAPKPKTLAPKPQPVPRLSYEDRLKNALLGIFMGVDGSQFQKLLSDLKPEQKDILWKQWATHERCRTCGMGIRADQPRVSIRDACRTCGWATMPGMPFRCLAREDDKTCGKARHGSRDHHKDPLTGNLWDSHTGIND
jgi:hypothetical protein